MKNLDIKQVFIMVGYPGSGKSTLAKLICQKLNCEYLSSDKIRFELFGTTRLDQAGNDVVMKQSKQAYQVMYQRAIDLVNDGRKVVLDATHIKTIKRESVLQKLLEEIKADKICFVLMKINRNKIDQRMSKHQQINKSGETVYQAWQRVINYFDQDKQKGLLSWPDQNEGIDIFLHDEIKAQLDKKN